MGPRREGKKDRAGQEEQTRVNARPPAKLTHAPEPYRRKTKDEQAQRSEPPEDVGRAQPWIEPVTDKANIFVSQTEGQDDQDNKQNLEKANNAREDV